jgi:aldose 1-epimerase
MGSFVVEDGRFGNLDTVRLTSTTTGARAVIARRGATLLRWDPAIGAEGPSDDGFVDGYLDEDELLAQAGVRSGVMAPFSNRIRNGVYTFGGERHDLLPGVPGPERLVYHGFLRLLDCDVVDTEVTDSDIRLRLATQQIRPGAFAGYPFAIDLDVEYVLSTNGLRLEVTGRNVGEQPAPYACGWHPYFRLGTRDVDPLELHVPARTAIRTDESLIPLAGAGAFLPVADEDRPTFATPRAVGDAVIDAAFTDLVPDPDGIVRTRLRDPRSGLEMTVWQRDGVMHVFTGDTLDREPRSSIALEPVELMTDAFNRPDCYDALVLAPGAHREFVCGVEVAAAA